MHKRCVVTVAMLSVMIWSGLAPRAQGDSKHYVGIETCAQCHEQEYQRFTAHSKKHHSFRSIEKLQDGLTAAEIQKCYGCHTTGFWQPGGFVDPLTTPAMKDLGCESCHGPGSLHATTEDPSHIRKNVTVEDCQQCHNAERVRAFNFKPLTHGGAH